MLKNSLLQTFQMHVYIDVFFLAVFCFNKFFEIIFQKIEEISSRPSGNIARFAI